MVLSWKEPIYLNIQGMPLGALGTNCYILHKNEKALIVDPGDETEKIVAFLKSNHLTPEAIVLTHAHFDHIGAVDDLRKKYSLPVYLHPDEKDWLTEPLYNGSGRFPRTPIVTSPPDEWIEEGTMTIGTFTFDVYHTPGHSPGSVTIVFTDDHIVLSGDALFQQGIGRTDLYGGDPQKLMESIQTKIYQLDERYSVFPGHGSSTTVGFEKVNNPYVRPII